MLRAPATSGAGAVLPGDRAQRGQRRTHLGRMVGVVVEDAHPAGRARPARSGGAPPRNRRVRRARRRPARRPRRAASRAASALSAMCRPGTASRIARGCGSPASWIWATAPVPCCSQLDQRPGQLGTGVRCRSAAPGHHGPHCVPPAPRRPGRRRTPPARRPGAAARRTRRTPRVGLRCCRRSPGGRPRCWSPPRRRGCTPAASRRSRRPRRRSSRRCRGARWCPPRPGRRRRRTTDRTRVLQRDNEHRRGGGLAVGAGDQQGALPAISLASTTGRRITGIPRRLASTSSGLVFGIAAWVVITAVGPPGSRSRCAASWPMLITAPRARSATTPRDSLASDPDTRPPRSSRIRAMPDMPAPPMPTMCTRARSGGSGRRVHRAALRPARATRARPRRPGARRRGVRPAPRPRSSPPAAGRR